MISKYSHMKSSGFYLITAEVAKCLPKNVIILLTYIYKAIVRLLYFPILWKFSQIIMFAKLNNPPNIPILYRPISILLYFSKICERLFHKRMSPHILSNNIPPTS